MLAHDKPPPDVEAVGVRSHRHAADDAARPNRLSIVIPCYNEAATLERLVELVVGADTLGLEKDIVIVDDGSADGSAAIVRALAGRYAEVRGLLRRANGGKGAALRDGLRAVSGAIVLIQDADLEYSPDDYPKLLGPILRGEADVVYGSRFMEAGPGHRGGPVQRLANRALTRLTNAATRLGLTDMETGYKAFRREVIDRVTIKENGFGVEPELTMKIGRLNPRPKLMEVPISYHARAYDQGKKLRWRDGLRAVYCILRYSLPGARAAALWRSRRRRPRPSSPDAGGYPPP